MRRKNFLHIQFVSAVRWKSLGPYSSKFGQILSTRRDLVPEQIGIELAKLQDAVPPFPGVQARQIVEQAFGRPIEVLDEFDETLWPPPPSPRCIPRLKMAEKS